MSGRVAILSLYLVLLLVLAPALPSGAAWLGITIQDDVTAEGNRRSVKVIDPGKDSPGARAGIRAGDVIVSANGTPIGTTQDFVRIIREAPAGKPVDIKVMRDGAVVSLTPVLSEPPAGVADLQRGMENLLKGRYEQAVADFTKALEFMPGTAEAYSGRARAQEKLKRYDRALADYSKLIELNPQAPAAYIGRGHVFMDLKRYDEALQDFSKAIELKPDVAASYVARCNVHELNRLHDRAIADCSRAVELEPNLDIGYSLRARAYAAKGMKQEAAADYERAARACIDNGLTAARAGRLDEALARFDRASRLDTKHRPEAYLNRGAAYEKKGENLKAVNDYSEAIRLRPDYAEAYLRRGYVFAQKFEDYGKARQDWEKAAILDPRGKTGEAARKSVKALGKTQKIP